MELQKKYDEVVKQSAMNLYQLHEICAESANEASADDILVFFASGSKVFSEVNVQLRRNPELDKYILVFNLE